VKRTSIERLLKALGIDAIPEGDRFKACCPDPKHEDSSPSWSIIAEGEKAGSHHCFGCGLNGGPWELVAAVRGLTLEEASRWIRRELGAHREAEEADIPVVRIVQPKRTPSEMALPWGVQIPSVDGTTWFKPAYEYLTKPIPDGGRGVAPWQVERWHIGFSVKGRNSLRMRVVVPIYTRGRLLSYVARAFINDGRPRYDVASPRPDRTGIIPDPGARPEVALFGEPGFDEGEVCTVAEGVFGMLAFERSGAPNPCAILGASNLGPEKIEMLARFKLLLVGTDPDAAGDRAFQAIYEALCRWTEVRRIPMIHKPDESTDYELNIAWQAALSGTDPIWPTDLQPSVP
jgi:hypothetical protein